MKSFREFINEAQSMSSEIVLVCKYTLGDKTVKETGSDMKSYLKKILKEELDAEVDKFDYDPRKKNHAVYFNMAEETWEEILKKVGKNRNNVNMFMTKKLLDKIKKDKLLDQTGGSEDTFSEFEGASIWSISTAKEKYKIGF